MKNRKFKVLMVLTLIVALTISAPMSVSAKAKKVGKVDAKMAMTYCPTSAAKAGELELSAFCSNAKKVVFYKASKLKGKYKKALTVKQGTSKFVKASAGLTFYKVQGINGKKKGKLSKVFATYNAGIQIAGIKAVEDGVVLSFAVDNTGDKAQDMIFKMNKDNGILVSGLNNDMPLPGTLVDETGVVVKTVTVAKNTQGVVNLKIALAPEVLALAQPQLETVLANGGKTDMMVSTSLGLTVNSQKLTAIINTSPDGFLYGICNR